MALIERLLQIEEPTLSIHAVHAAIGEWLRERVTQAQLVTEFGLAAADETEAAALLAKMVLPPETISLGGFVTLTNIGTTYDNTSASKGLGFARIQTAGISRVEFRLRVNKVGSGTQSWQCWDDTNALEITVIDDAGATGDKELGTVLNFGSPLAQGQRTVRVRAKSTTGSDDPVYYGASLQLTRVAILTPDVLHEILLYMYETGKTPAEVRSRLGL